MKITNKTIKMLTDSAAADSVALVSASKAYDALYADGVRACHMLKSNESFNAEVFNAVQGAIVVGLFNDSDFELFNLGADHAKAQNRGAERTKLTKLISGRMGKVRDALNSRDPVKQAEKEAAAAAKKAEKGATGEHGDQSTSDSEKKPDSAMKGINPSENRQSYMAALNLMISATRQHGDKIVHKNADTWCAAFGLMLQELNK